MPNYKNGSVIGVQNTPTTMAASGMWDINSVRDFIDDGIWPAEDPLSSFLCHFNGADTSTTFTDEKGHTITANGNAQLDTAQAKFGTASLLLDGAGDFATITYSAALLIGTGDFGIDFWCMPAADQTLRMIFGNRAVLSDTSWYFRIDTTTNRPQIGSGAGAVSFTGTAMSNSVWTHLYFGRQGTTHFFGQGGSVSSSGTNGGNNYSATTSPRIGSDEAADLGQFNGWVDEVRMIVGACPWTANFTPLTRSYNN